MKTVYLILSFLAGIGVFLFGLKIISENLERVAGKNLRKSVLKFTNTKTKSIGFGFFVTAMLQSSAASLAMYMSFASIGIISITQGIGLVLGSNIGTIVGELLISFNAFKVTEIFASITVIGAFMAMLSKKSMVRYVGYCLAGFGMMFVGLGLMSGAASPLKSSPIFINTMARLNHPILLILVGYVFCTLVQSSLGSIAILMTLATGVGGGTGVLTLYQCAFLIAGINIGTTMTAVLVSLTGNTNAKRVAFTHLFFNVIAAIIFSICMLFIPWHKWIAHIPQTSIQIVVMNLVIKGIAVIFVAPFINPAAKGLKKMFKEKAEKSDLAIFNIPEDVLERPALAIHQINSLNVKLLDYLEDMLKCAVNHFTGGDIPLIDMNGKRDRVAKATMKLNEQTIKMSGGLSKNEVFEVSSLFSFFSEVNNLQSAIYKFYEFGTEYVQNKGREAVLKEVRQVLEKVNAIFKGTKGIFMNIVNNNKKDNSRLMMAILENEESIAALKNNAKKKRLEEMRKNVDFSGDKSYILFNNTINVLEEIGERLSNISIKV